MIKEDEEKVTHVRRCHLCNTINMVEAAVVTKCGGCNKHFAPFLFFNEKAALGIEADPAHQRPKIDNWEHLIKAQYPPLWGLAVYW